MHDRLLTTLKRLRLSGLARSLDVRLQEAAGHQLNHAEFLELILQDELLVRDERQVARRVKAADFRELKPLDDFDWSFNPSINRKQVYDLATCRFIRERRDVLLLGPPGVGKSFLVQALGQQAIKQGFLVYYRSIFDVVRDFLHEQALVDDKVLAKYLKPDLLIVDDMGMKQLPRKSGELLFEIIMRRYEVRSTIMTSNRPLEDWGKLIGDVPSATAILDRFLHHAETLRFRTKHYIGMAVAAVLVVAIAYLDWQQHGGIHAIVTAGIVAGSWALGFSIVFMDDTPNPQKRARRVTFRMLSVALGGTLLLLALQCIARLVGHPF